MILYFIGTIYTLASTAFVILLLGKLFCVKSLTVIYDHVELTCELVIALGYAVLAVTILFGIAIFFKIEPLLALTVFVMIIGLGLFSLGLVVILCFNIHKRIAKWHLNLKHKKNM